MTDIRENNLWLNKAQPTEENDPMLEDYKDPDVKNKEKGKIKTVGPIQIFRYANGLDIFYMIIGILGAIGNGLAQPLMFVVFGDLIDSFMCYNASLTNTTECAKFKPLSDQMTVFSFYYVGIGAGVIICAYFQVSFWVLAAARQTRRMRQKFFHSVLSKEIGWFDVTQSGELNTRLTEDINKINDGIGDKVGHLLQNVSTFVFGLLIGFIYGWKLALVLIAAGPVLTISTAISSKMLVALTSKELTAYAKAGAVAEEVLSSIRTVVAFGGQEKELKRYTNNLGEAKKIGIKKAITSQLSVGFMFFIIYATHALGFWYGATLVLSENDYTIGRVMSVFFCVIFSSYCLGQAASHFEAFSVARGAAYSIFNIIDQPSKIDSFSREGYKPDNIIGNIEFRNVHFSYPSRMTVQVLKGLNLTVKSGQTVALVGQSGCGKSTTVQLLQRLYDPQDGEFPTTPQEWQTVAADFSRRWNFPNCGGAIDGKHVRIVPPPHSGSHYYNYKGFHSVVLMAVVSANYEFLYLDVGKNGRMSDGGVFAETEFAQRLLSEDLGLPPAEDNEEGLPFVFVADEAFALGPHLMRPFPQRALTPERRVFNYRLARARRVVENAFGIMASRFRLFLTAINMAEYKLNYIITCCCILHNYLKKHSSSYLTLLPDDPVDIPEAARDAAHPQLAPRNARAVRQAYVDYFMGRGAIPMPDLG